MALPIFLTESGKSNRRASKLIVKHAKDMLAAIDGSLRLVVEMPSFGERQVGMP
jgi:hypothetical protein